MIGYDPNTKVETWQKVMESDDLDTLKEFLGNNYRIIDRATGGYGREIFRSELE
jgi:hypothetical protein